MASQPPGLYAEAGRASDPEEGLWLAFLIAYLCPLEGDEPFAALSAARTAWASGELPDLAAVAAGPRSAHDPGRGDRTLVAYRAWAQRAGSQAAALAGEPHWSPERRFARAFERLALPGLQRAARFEFLVSVGALGLCDVAAASLFPGDDEAGVGAKRLLGIADALLVDRRAVELAEACGVPLAALDLAFFNWQHPEGRATMGATVTADEVAVKAVEAALAL